MGPLHVSRGRVEARRIQALNRATCEFNGRGEAAASAMRGSSYHRATMFPHLPHLPHLLPLLAQTNEQLRTGTITEGVGRLRSTGQSIIEALPSLGVGVVVFVLFLLAGKLLRRFIRQWWGGVGATHRNLALVLSRITIGLSAVLGMLVAAVIVFPGFTPTSLLTSLGIGSVAIGFAFRDVLQNYLAGILLLLSEPFRIGDQIVFKGFEGTVEDIQTRATFIRTYDGRRTVIPNSELFTNSVTVNTAFDKRRVEYDIGIGYGDDIETAKRIVLDVLRDAAAALDDPAPEVLTYELAASTVNLRARWWINPPGRREVLDARDHILTDLKKRLTEAGIDLPFPTQQVLIHDQTEQTDGDRAAQREGWPGLPHAGNPRPRAEASAGLSRSDGGTGGGPAA